MVIVVFSGTQGCGKSTLIDRLSSGLNSLSIPNFIYQEHVDHLALQMSYGDRYRWGFAFQCYQFGMEFNKYKKMVLEDANNPKSVILADRIHLDSVIYAKAARDIGIISSYEYDNLFKIYKFYDELLLRWLKENNIENRVFSGRDIKYADMFISMKTDTKILQENLNRRDHRYETNPDSIGTDEEYLDILSIYNDRWFEYLAEKHHVHRLFNFTTLDAKKQEEEILYIVGKIIKMLK